MDKNKFDVWQFFSGGSKERVLLRGSAEEAMLKALELKRSGGAKIGTTIRIIVVDSGDLITWEWRFARGVIFPTVHHLISDDRYLKGTHGILFVEPGRGLSTAFVDPFGRKRIRVDSVGVEERPISESVFDLPAHLVRLEEGDLYGREKPL